MTAVSTIAYQVDAPYVQITLNQPGYTNAYLQGGFRLAHKEWGTFMVKPLTEDVFFLRLVYWYDNSQQMRALL